MGNFQSILERCVLCPRMCRIDRTKGERGYCGVGDTVRIAYYGPHYGEEPPISGRNGSGNIFFSSCNLRCVYCQNFQISHGWMGKAMSIDDLVEVFISLQAMDLHNINLVSPTPYVPFTAKAIERARENGLSIPIVYNTHAYETVDTLKALHGLVDIYLPDFKYWGSGVAYHLSSASDYPDVAKKAIVEMKHQVGNLVIEGGLAKKGILVRHLVLPANLAGSRQVLRWIKNALGPQTYLSLMAQYHPVHRAQDYPMLRRGLRRKEYDLLVAFAQEEGFENVFVQELESASLFVPDFDRQQPFDQIMGAQVDGEGQTFQSLLSDSFAARAN